jgi:hypothetical protein
MIHGYTCDGGRLFARYVSSEQIRTNRHAVGSATAVQADRLKRHADSRSSNGLLRSDAVRPPHTA